MAAHPCCIRHRRAVPAQRRPRVRPDLDLRSGRWRPLTRKGRAGGINVEAFHTSGDYFYELVNVLSANVAQ